MTIEQEVLKYIDMHPRCTRMDIQSGLGFSLGEVNGCLAVLGDKVSVVSNFEFPNRFVTKVD